MPRGTVSAGATTPSVEADDLMSFLASLEDIQSAATGYGELLECVVLMDDNSGAVVRAKWNDRSWTITIEERK
jgi:hypothetical protein